MRLQLLNECEQCHNQLPSGGKSPQKRFCDNCLMIRRKEQQRTHMKKYKRINLTEQEIKFLHENNISLTKLVHYVLKQEMNK